jgi:hypothetical protein
MFQLELVRQITFWCLFVVSAFLSVNLYTGLVDGIYNRIFIAAVAIVIEGVKILCLTSANTARWQSSQHKLNHMREAMLGFFTRKKRKAIKDPELLKDVLDASRKNRTSFGLYSIYIFCAIVSISASFGYIIQTVNNATTHAISTNNSDTIAVYKDTFNQYDSMIKDNQKTILQDQGSIDQYNKLISALDTSADDFQKNRSLYQTNINTYQRQITQLQQSNIDLQNKKIDANDKIQNYKVQDTQTIKDTHETMYQLMGGVLGIPDKTIMFILLYMLAFIIEIGLFICSPHFNKMDDGGRPKVTFKSVKQEKENYEKEETAKITQPVPPVVEATMEAPVEEQKTVTEYSSTENSSLEPEVPVEENMEPREAVEPVEIVPEDSLIFEPTPATTIEEVEEDVPVRTIDPVENRFIDALFNNNGRRNLKDKYVAGSEIRMRKYDAMKLFDWLTKTKEGAYPLIEFREDKLWYPNVTSELIKTRIKESNYAWRKH